MNYNLIYYGRKARIFLLFTIKFIDVFLFIVIIWIIGAAVVLIRRKILYGTINDRPKEDGYLHPIHDRRENIMLLVCVMLLIMQLYILSLPLPTI